MPGTPEVNITVFDDGFKNPHHGPRVNGFKLIKDDPASKNATVPRQSIKKEPSSPSYLSDPLQNKSPKTDNCFSSLGANSVKKEPLSPKNRINDTVDDSMSVQSNGEVGNKSKTTQPKSKPPILKMPFER